MGTGTPFSRDVYDLALAGAQFMLEREPGSAGDESTRANLATLTSRRTLRELAPAWEHAGAALVERGAISHDEIETLVTERAPHESFAQLLLRKTKLAEGVVAEVIADATSAPVIALTTYPVHGEPFRSAEDALIAPKQPVVVDELAARRLPRELSERHDMVLVAAWDDSGVIAMVDPADEHAAREAQEATGLRLVRFTALASQLRLAVERCWQPRPDVEVPPTGTPRQALPFLTAVGVPLAVLALIFVFIFREVLDLRHHFALASLAIGLFFFSYALRYYVTTAAVLGTVLFGDRLRRNRLISRIRAAQGAAQPASAHEYRTLRGEHLDDIGAIVTADPERIGKHRLPREEQPFVSVQLAMYNERHVVDRLLGACTSFDYDNYEVIVADDSTDPEALAILDKWSGHPRVRVLHRPTRKGFKGGALQEALKRMDPRTEYVMIFDADFIPPPDAIWHFLDYFGRLPAAEGASPAAPSASDDLAAVQGYQWHMLNASENWITKGIRTEFSGSYVLERAAQELFGTMKMISGSVYMIRADVLRRLGWSTSITEDWELTIRLYLAGYKVLYTPYIQAPSECVSGMKQLVKQRMRWARGHTFNVKKYFFAVLRSPNMTWREKAEFLYYAPYYLQSILFLAGSVAWIVGIFLMGQRLPQWGATLGWSLVVSNVFALPLMNLAGLILEGSVKRDLVGLGSFMGLSTLLAPFQGWAALRGLLEPTEGGWHRTAKSGRITEAIGTRLGRIIPWELPRKRGMISSRASHILVTCVAGFLAGAILTMGVLSMRAAASTATVQPADLVTPFVLGTLVPLGTVLYGWFRLHRRIAVCILAAVVGLSSNVVFLAGAVPANATADLTNVFTFKYSTAFGSPSFDMQQGYTPSGTAKYCGISPEFRAGTSAGGLSTTNVQPNKPAGTVQNDILIAALYLEAGAGTITVPGGWTLLTSVTQTGSTPDYTLYIYWKRATPWEPANYLWLWTTAQWAAINVVAYSGAVLSGDPFNAFASVANGTAGAQPTTPSITTTVQYTTTVAAFGNFQSSTYTPGTGYTERVDMGDDVYVQDMEMEAAGATGAASATASVPSWGSGVIMALKGTARGADYLCRWSSDTFTSTMSMSGPSAATADVYADNNISTISLVGGGTMYVSSTSGATVTPVIPSGWAANDLAILVIAGRPTNTTDPTVTCGGCAGGWTLRSSRLREMGANDLKILTYYRKLQTGDGNPSFTVPASWSGNSAGISGQIAVWRGVDQTTPFDTADVSGDNAAATQWTAPGITTASTNARVVSVAVSSDNNNLDLYNLGPCWPNCSLMWSGIMAGVTFATTTGGDHAVGMIEGIAGSQEAAGAMTMFQWNQTANGADQWAGITFALRPEQRSCTVTANLRHVSGTTTVVGSGSSNFTSPSPLTPTAATAITITPTSAVTFADLDRLELELSVPNSANCRIRFHFDGPSQPSKLTTATIVPEGMLALLLLAPALPIAIKRRWIRVPFR